MTNAWFEKGHVAIVTGGSKGLGKALTRRLLQQGFSVITDGRDPERLEETRRELAPLGHLVTISGDVADPEHAHSLIAAAEHIGRLNLLVNNASTLGETPLPRIDRLSQSVFEDLFRTNVFAPIHLMQHALRLMKRSGEPAAIVNISSDAARQAYLGWGGYGATKAALEHVSLVLAAEIEGSGVRVLVVDPTDMDTDMHLAAVPDADRSSLANPNDVAGALLDAIADMRAPFERVTLPIAQPV
jgi:NAD(P)-dependent dehydrogenase (short-subunit alcohol dehydrogenase family)